MVEATGLLLLVVLLLLLTVLLTVLLLLLENWIRPRRPASTVLCFHLLIWCGLRVLFAALLACCVRLELEVSCVKLVETVEHLWL